MLIDGEGAPSRSAGAVRFILVSLRSRTSEQVKQNCACPSQPFRNLTCSVLKIKILNYLRIMFHRNSAERKQVVAKIVV